MKDGLTRATIHALRDAICAPDLARPGVARRLVLQRIEEMPLTDEEWAALLTFIQIFEMHGLSLGALRGLVAMLAAATPGSDE